MTVLITARQLAAWLKISKRSLYRMRSAGQLPEPIRLRGAVRWRAADIEAWLTASCRT
jgi:predicted DNA-binding transcriptional regulator AlpA